MDPEAQGALAKLFGLAQKEAKTPELATRALSIPTPEQIHKRIQETEVLLAHLKDIAQILEAHPDIERLFATMAKLGNL